MLFITISMNAEKRNRNGRSFKQGSWKRKHRKAEIEYKQGNRTFITQ